MQRHLAVWTASLPGKWRPLAWRLKVPLKHLSKAEESPDGLTVHGKRRLSHEVIWGSASQGERPRLRLAQRDGRHHTQHPENDEPGEHQSVNLRARAHPVEARGAPPRVGGLLVSLWSPDLNRPGSTRKGR